MSFRVGMSLRQDHHSRPRGPAESTPGSPGPETARKQPCCFRGVVSRARSGSGGFPLHLRQRPAAGRLNRYASVGGSSKNSLCHASTVNPGMDACLGSRIVVPVTGIQSSPPFERRTTRSVETDASWCSQRWKKGVSMNDGNQVAVDYACSSIRKAPVPHTREGVLTSSTRRPGITAVPPPDIPRNLCRIGRHLSGTCRARDSARSLAPGGATAACRRAPRSPVPRSADPRM